MVNDGKRYMESYSQTRCDIGYVLLKMHQNFFGRTVKGTEKAGFPGFKLKDTNMNAEEARAVCVWRDFTKIQKKRE